MKVTKVDYKNKYGKKLQILHVEFFLNEAVIDGFYLIDKFRRECICLLIDLKYVISWEF